MSEAKHTPGPWEYPADHCGYDQVVAWSGGANFGVPRDIFVAVEGRTEEQVEADARLIAAAPDLFALAKAYERWEADLLECREAWDDGRADLPTLTQKLWDHLLEIQEMRNDAMAKVKGGAE